MKNKIFTIIFVCFFAFLFLLEGLYLFVFPHYLKKYILSFDFNKNLNISANIDNLKIKTYPNFSVRFLSDEILLSGLDNSSLYLKNLDFKVFLPSLINQKLTINHFNADKINVSSVRKNSNEFIILVNLLDFPKNNDIKLKLNKSKVNLKEYKFDLNDLYLKKNLSVNGSNLLVKDFTQDKKIIASSKGSIVVDNYIAPFYFDVNLKLPFLKSFDYDNFKLNSQFFNFDLSLLNPFLQLFDIDEFKSIKSLNGKIYLKIDNSKDNNLKININTNDLLVKKTGEWNDIALKAPARITSLVTFNDDELKINHYSIISKGLDIKGDGLITKYDTDKPNLDIKVYLKNIDGKTGINFLPSEGAAKKHPNQIRMLKKYNYNGILNGKLYIVGTLPEPNVYGDLSFKDVYLIEPIKNSKKATIDVRLNGNIVGVHAYVPLYDEFVDVLGYNKIYDDEYGEYYITSSKNVDLSIVRKLLVPIAETFDFLIGPVPYFQSISGLGNIILDIKGTMQNSSLIGRMNFKDVDIIYEGINAQITSATGKVDFLDKKINFMTDKAKFKNADTTIIVNADLIGHFKCLLKFLNADVSELFNVLKTSDVLAPYRDSANLISKVSGNVDLDVNTDGFIANIKKFNLTNNIKPVASIKLKNNEVYLNGINYPIKALQGHIYMQDNLINILSSGKMSNSPLKIDGKIKGNQANIDILSPKMYLKDAIDFGVKSDFLKNYNLKTLPSTSSAFSMAMNYKSKSKNLNFDDISLNGKFLKIPNQNKELEIYSGEFLLKKGNLIFKNINSSFYNAKVALNGKLENLFKKPLLTTVIKANNLDLALLNNIKKINFSSPDLNKILNNYNNYSGFVDIDVKIIKNKLKGYIDLSKISFYHSKYKTPFSIINGSVEFYPDKIYLKSINAVFDGTPIFFDIKIKDYLKKPTLNGYFTVKLTDDFVNTYINSHLTYPVKVKGDIVLSSKFEGTKDNINIYPKLRLQENADIFYKGASLEDLSNIREINANINVSPQKISIKNFEYTKFLSSQNHNLYPLSILKLKGDILKKGEDFYFKALNINTPNKANAKILNVLFGKSVLKKGLIDCNLTLNGNITYPIVLGKVVFENFSIPLYDTVINNTYLNFKKDVVDISLKADLLESDLQVNATILNRLKPPIIVKNINISSGKINTTNVIDFLSEVKPTANQNTFIATNKNQYLEMPKIIIEKGTILANDVIIKNSSANNLIAEFNLDNNSIFNFNKINFSIADGEIFSNNASINVNSGDLSANFYAQNIDSNKIADLLFDMKNQITGKLNGSLLIKTKGLTQYDRLKNAKGNVYFEVQKGFISKLGSLEYLLRANNILNTGITGLSLNKIINVFAPVDKGNFSSIQGNMQISDGMIKNVEVTSIGKNLCLYISGEYNLLSEYADFVVLGRLTNKIHNLLGGLGNVSISSIFHIIPVISASDSKFVQDLSKIPGIDLTNDDFKVFKATVKGDLNDDNVEKSFKWVSHSKIFQVIEK